MVSVWLRLLEVTRRYPIRVNLDTVRSIRAFLLYDTLTARLHPEMGSGTSRRYLREAARRRARRAITEPPGPRPDELLRVAESSVDALRPALESIEVTWQQLTRTRTLAIRGALRSARVAAAAVAVLFFARIVEVDTGGWVLAVSAGWIGLILAGTAREGMYALRRRR